MHEVSDAGSANGHVRAEQVQRLLDQLPALIAYWDKDLCNEVANAAYVEYFGRSPEQMRGMHISEVLGPQVYRSNEPYLRSALQGEEQHFHRTLVDTTGRVHHTQASYIPDIVDDRVQGIFVLVTDVTPRVDAQRELDEAQELAGLGRWSMRPGSSIVTWSRQLYRLAGQDPASFTPSHEAYRSLIHPDDIDRVRLVQAEKLWSERTSTSATGWSSTARCGAWPAGPGQSSVPTASRCCFAERCRTSRRSSGRPLPWSRPTGC